MMSREERQLEVSLDQTIQRVTDLKNSINSFIMKLEAEYMTMNWLSVLDNYALLSGQLNTLNRLLKNDKMPVFKNFSVIPQQLCPDRDLELEKLTEGRLTVFDHDAAPLYLRTKPDPEIDDKITLLVDKSNKVSADGLQKQTTALNKLATTAESLVKQFKESLESDVQKHQLPQLSSPTDTNALISAIIFGKGIKPSQRPVSPGAGGQSVQQATHADQRMAAMVQAQQGAGSMQMNKAPSTIKTNIKAAMHPHPYNR